MPQTEKDWLETLAQLPVSRFFSDTTWHAIRGYLASGASQQRGYRLVEFFKALDWLPLEDIEPNPLKQFSGQDVRQIHRDIQAYFAQKDAKRQAQKTQREQYKLKVFEYFREHVSAEDKALLESLRDYELDRIGEDVNWRHYFWLSSFKKIDAFNRQTPSERKATIAQFKQDVEIRYKNAERLREGTYAQYYWGHGFESAGETFDEWLNRQSAAFQEQVRNRRPRQHHVWVSGISPELQQAYRQLKLAPTASPAEVRQQFRKLVLQHHPDMPDGDSETLKRILHAYDIVKKGHPSLSS